MELSVTLFKAVLQASVAATILALIVFVLERILRKRLSPAWLFALYLPVVVRLLWPTFPESPTSIFNVGQWIQLDRSEVRAAPTVPEGPTTPVVEPAGLVLNPIANSPKRGGSAAVAAPAVTLLHVISLIWLGISNMLVLRLVVGWWRLRRLLLKEGAISAELSSLLDGLRRAFGGVGAVKIVETSRVQSPCLFGFWKPKILLPAGFSQRLSGRELRHVILHELAHLKRRDQIVNAFTVLAQTLHWFNPIVWLLLRRMRLLRELACDRMVLESQGTDLVEARAYGETLLKLIQECPPSPCPPALIGIMEGEQSVKERLRQVAKFKCGARGNRTMGFLLLLMLAVIGLSNAQTKKIAPASEEREQPLHDGIRSETTKVSAGIQMLEEEWTRQKKEVNAKAERMDELRRKLNISSLEEAKSNAEDQLFLQQRLKTVTEQHSYDNAMLNHLKSLDRAALRKALPTALRPPDELLNRYLADLGSAEQKLIVLTENFSDDHPDVKGAHNLIRKIEEQIEHRMDGILAGLEARKVVAQNLSSELKAEMHDSQAGDADRRQKLAPYFIAKREFENAQRILDTIFMRLLAEKLDAQHHRIQGTQPEK